jgi:hypothetical protein
MGWEGDRTAGVPPWGYVVHCGMPTARRRYQVTETEAVERALEAAAEQWPDEPRSRLMLRVINAGGDAVAQRAIAQSRLAAMKRVAGAYMDAFGSDYLTRLRDDWPE